MDDIELIKSRINVVDLIQEYIPLKKTGANFKSNCPFHQEKSPSFVVSPERGIWHCFGCSLGGDIFKFLMLKEGIEFKEALEILAQKAGVELKQKKGDKDQKNSTERLYELNQKAAQFFQHILTKHEFGTQALEYLHKRGLTDKTIEEFGLGYAPDSWDSLSGFLQKRKFTVEELIKAGAAVESKQGCYDRFRGRIMFPLIDVRNRMIGFSGRILDKGEPKYINTPETPIFHKGSYLFGLQLSKQAIRDKKEALLVEGEMDMLLSYQSGVKNIVASKGTALTEEQISLLQKYTETISLCFDMDLAGDAASRRGIEMADRAGMQIKVIQVVGGKDPADVCLNNPKEWKMMVAEAMPIYDYYLDSVSKRFNEKTAEGKRQIFNEVSPIWQKITDPFVKDHYIQKLAALLQTKDELIRRQIDRAPRLVTTNSVVQPAVARKDDKVVGLDRRRRLEEYLVALNLHIPSTLTYVPNFPETLFTQEHLKQIYVLLVIYLDTIAFAGKAFRISDFVKSLSEELLPEVDRLYLMELDEKLEDEATWQKEVQTVLAELKKMLIKASLEKLSAQIKTAQEFEKVETLETLNKRFRDLSLKLKNL